MAGLELEDWRRGYAKIRLPLANNTNPIGTMFATSQFILADAGIQTIMFNFNSVDWKVDICDLFSITYKKAARSDLTVEVQVEETTLKEI